MCKVTKIFGKEERFWEKRENKRLDWTSFEAIWQDLPDMLKSTNLKTKS
jgi:hypothetical protein